jgi:hypothetical protein
MATKKVTPAAAKTTAKKATEKKTVAKKATTKKATTAKTKTTGTKKTKPVFTEADIRQKAQEIYHARIASGEPGTEESDWLKAEEALKAGK